MCRCSATRSSVRWAVWPPPHEPALERAQPLSPPARPQPRGLVPLGRRGLCQGPNRREAHLPVDRLLDLPLVPCDGARVVREPRRRARAQRALRLHQSGPRGAPGRGSRLHDLRAGHDRLRRLADERLAHARSEAVLWRHLFSAVLEVEPSGLHSDPGRDREGLGRRTAEGTRVGREPDGAASGQPATGRSRRGDPGRRCAPPYGGAVQGGVRRTARRVWRCAEVPTAERIAVPAPRVRAGRRRRGAGHRCRDAQSHCAWRHARPRGRRVSPLLGRRGLACTAFREDALRPGPAGAGAGRGRAGVR